MRYPSIKPINEKCPMTNAVSEIYLLNLTGRDRPGLMASVASVLAAWDVNVLDIGQAVIHEHISLGLLVEIPPRSRRNCRDERSALRRA